LKRVAFALLVLASCKRKQPESFTDIYLAEDHACGKVTSGAIVCWGGRYGDVPRAVPELSALPAHEEGNVAKGRAHTCARLPNGTVACHGDNSSYQLADGSQVSRQEPKLVYGLAGVKKLVAAGDSTCALLSDGDVRCWGANGSGQIAPQMHPRVAINVPTSVRH
jgi:alpha-tubulin suppressor-like RCC1 family protein